MGYTIPHYNHVLDLEADLRATARMDALEPLAPPPPAPADEDFDARYADVPCQPHSVAGRRPPPRPDFWLAAEAIVGVTPSIAALEAWRDEGLKRSRLRAAAEPARRREQTLDAVLTAIALAALVGLLIAWLMPAA